MNSELSEQNSFYVNYDPFEAMESFEFTEDHRLKGMCRVCASPENKLISIFGAEGKKKAALELIHSFLPILVTPEDLLPTSICVICLAVLKKIQLLVENTIKADNIMRDMLNKIIADISQDCGKPTEDNECSPSKAKIIKKIGPQNRWKIEPNILTESNPGDSLDTLQTKIVKSRSGRSQEHLLCRDKIQLHQTCSISNRKILNTDLHSKADVKSHQDVEITSCKGPMESGKEVHWRCGFCGTKARSKDKLVEHCQIRHKERIGRSLAQTQELECFRCKKSFISEVWLKDHLCNAILTVPKLAITTKAMSCLSCPDIFYDVKEFRRHLLSHTNSVRCNVCGAHFRSDANLETHMEKHEKKPSHVCPHCPRVFQLKSRLKIHMRTHTGERPYMCVKCGKRFSTDCGFRLHMSAHEGKKPYVCAACGQTFNRPSNLRRHEVICRRDKKLLCGICQDSFVKREDLLCHRAMHSKDEKEAAQTLQDGAGMVLKEEKFSCKVCSMKFDRVVNLSQHRKESHTVNELENARKAGRFDGGAFVCAECGRELYCKRNYERHLLTHAGETRFTCIICSNKYTTKFALDYHMYNHTGERPFKCDLCTQGFKTKISLRVHRMKHTGEKPYKCRSCSMGFMTAQSLRLHLVSHSDLRMFSCEYCSATFKRKKTLVTHVRIHTGEKPFACQYCGRRFTQKGTCSQHEKSHAEARNSQQKSVTSVQATEPGLHVTIIKDWKKKLSGSLCDQDATLEVLVSEGSRVLPNEGVQHMVLIEQDCIVDEQEIMAVNEEMVLEATHTVVIEQDGILSETPISGLKDENSDPQMPVPDE